MKRVCLFLLLIVLLSIQPATVLAQSAPSCSFQPDGSIICTTGGGNDGGGDDGGGNKLHAGMNTCEHVVNVHAVVGVDVVIDE